MHLVNLLQLVRTSVEYFCDVIRNLSPFDPNHVKLTLEIKISF